MNSRHPLTIAVVASFVFALGLRLWNLKWGLPFNYHPAEQVAYDTAIAMARAGTLDPGWFGWPSGLFDIEVVVVHLLHSVSGLGLELSRGIAESPGMVAGDQWRYLLAGRVIVAVMGALTAALVAASAGRLRSGWAVPVLAGFACAAWPLHVEASHFVAPDVPASFGIALALFASLGLIQGKRGLRRAVLAGLAVGLAASFSYAAILVLLPALLAVFLGRQPLWKKGPSLLAVAGVALGVFLLLTPWALGSRSAVLAGLGQGVWHVLPGTGLERATVTRLGDPSVLGSLALIVMGMALPLLLVDRFRRRFAAPLAVLLLLPVLYLLLGAAGRLALVPALVQLAPALALLIGVTAAGLAHELRTWAFRGPVLGLVGLALLPLFLAGGERARDLGVTRTETRAYEWFVDHVPPGARIIREWSGPHLPSDRFQVMALRSVEMIEADELADLEPDFVVVSSVSYSPPAPPIFWDNDDAEVESAYHLLAGGHVAVEVCPDPGRLAGPTLWIVAFSERARRLTPRGEELGQCGH